MDVEPEPLAEDDADSFIVVAFPFIVERLGGGAEMMISMMIEDEDDKIIMGSLRIQHDGDARIKEFLRMYPAEKVSRDVSTYVLIT